MRPHLVEAAQASGIENGGSVVTSKRNHEFFPGAWRLARHHFEGRRGFLGLWILELSVLLLSLKASREPWILKIELPAFMYNSYLARVLLDKIIKTLKHRCMVRLHYSISTVEIGS